MLLLTYAGMVFLAFVGSRLNGRHGMGIFFAIMCVTGTVLMMLVMDNISDIAAVICSWIPGLVLDFAFFFLWINERLTRQISQTRERVISMLTEERKVLRQRGEELATQLEPMLVTSALIELIFACSNDYSLYDFGDEISLRWEKRAQQSEELTQITRRINVIDLRLQAVEATSDLKRLKDFETAISAEQSEI